MKHTKIPKTESPVIKDDRDYLSSSMFLKKDQNNPAETDNNIPVNKPVENSKKNRHFDLFAHILEG
jgi:hypothetical protein